MNGWTVAALAAAALGAFVADRLGIPGGLMLGSLVGAAAVTLGRDISIHIPDFLNQGAQVLIGTAIGVQITRSSLGSLGWSLLPALLSAVLIIGAGVAIAYLLRALHIAPPGDLLATSPGALSVVSSLALERGMDAAHIAMFHLVRVVLVLATLPLLARMLPG
jgi:membrane AbrB-like protein